MGNETNSADKGRSRKHSPGVLLGGFSLVTAIGIIAGTLAIYNDSTEVMDRERANRERFRDEIIAQARNEFKIDLLTEWATIGKDFATLWPNQLWPGYEQLPVDNEQNARLNAAEDQIQRIITYVRKHCELSRDAGDREQSCTDI